MRIHRLEIQAFGPFAERQIIDFDSLSGQGLFLLNGATGAGKTSVLDAICYALYGSVPGARQSGKRLRSDHAAEGMEPQVICEFSASGRHLEVLRSPAWERPAKRGSGTTTQQAKTQLREKENGVWEEKSTRNDEAGAEITGLLGMDKDQFTKVVLLAQGDFAAFLRSKADDRQELLQKLFGTQVYKNLERQLAADAVAAKMALADKEQELQRLESLARSQAESLLGVQGRTPDGPPREAPGAADVDRAGTWSGPVGVLPGAADGGAADAEAAAGRRLFDVLLGRLELAHGAAEAAAASSRSDEQAAAAALEFAEQLRTRHRKLQSAEAERSRLAQAEPEFVGWQQRALAHREAEVLTGQLTGLARAASVSATAEGAAARALDRLLADKTALPLTGLTGYGAGVSGPAAAGSAGVGSDVSGLTGAGRDVSDLDLSGSAGAVSDGVDPRGPNHSVLVVAQKRLDREIAIVEESLPDEDRLAALQSELAGTETALENARAAALTHASASAAATKESTALAGGLEGLRVLAGATGQRSLAVNAATELLAVIRAHRTAEQQVARCGQEHHDAQLVFLTAKEHWLELLKRRLELAAGELAAKLVEGKPCPVCGSELHPCPSELATTGLQAVEEEEQAKLHRDETELASAAAVQKLNEARQHLAGLAAKGGAADEAATERDAAAAGRALTEAKNGAVALKNQERQLEILGVQIREQDGLCASARERAAGLAASQLAMHRDVNRLDAKLAASREGFGSLAAKLSELRRVALLLVRASTAVQASDSAKAAFGSAQEALELALPATRFVDAGSARKALLGADEASALLERIRSHQEDLVRCAASFEAEDVMTAADEADAGMAVPNDARLGQLHALARTAAETAGEAVLRRGLASQALDAVRAAAQQHAELDEVVEPLRGHADRVGSLADTVRGLGDNTYKMPLNSYVLAARLEQVAAAASGRLRTMSDGRYTLSYSDALAGGNQKSGLGLQVVDEWTGQSRETATLSGGESFMASLALALGLADVVQQEAGGVDIETLFVDEGFGSLDEQSLEQVMDALEGLRAGGRVVGLVSHVAEMKLRIPAQLHVHKGRTGSTVSVLDGAAMANS
ncbi:SMC family ATPase [Paenarthrobacter sp. PH39-S1]|uniref:AAA family ATPase n=1 Tax=Paenarthrobacter sp. PH39-S1 TaxID=3046204 RepID=UPI0024BBC664|nr:SMC family ATPase [Paenarthrobacter sp. PH39-S1]MDJ0358335.1 SMC family ATPase [Paenarthrobacter sp. PH39-S1]